MAFSPTTETISTYARSIRLFLLIRNCGCEEGFRVGAPLIRLRHVGLYELVFD